MTGRFVFRELPTDVTEVFPAKAQTNAVAAKRSGPGKIPMPVEP